MKPLYLLKPVAILLFIFLFDKIFFLPAVKEQTVVWYQIEPLIYESRDDLLNVITEKYPLYNREKKTGLILGTSRSGAFKCDEISGQIGNAVTWNFSAPLAGTAWHNYWLHRILDKDIKLSYVIIEADPLLFTNEALTYPLTYSFDTKYVLANLDLSLFGNDPEKGFSFDAAETFFLKNSFALYKYPFNISHIKENHKEIMIPGENNTIQITNGIKFKENYAIKINEINRSKFGSIPNDIQMPVTPEMLKKDALNSFIKFGLMNFQASTTQTRLFRNTLETLAKNSIPAVIYRPPMTYELDELVRASKPNMAMIADIEKMVADMKIKYPASQLVYMDLQNDKDLKCRTFNDSYHLSGICYDEVSSILTKKLKSAFLLQQ